MGTKEMDVPTTQRSPPHYRPNNVESLVGLCEECLRACRRAQKPVLSLTKDGNLRRAVTCIPRLPPEEGEGVVLSHTGERFGESETVSSDTTQRSPPHRHPDDVESGAGGSAPQSLAFP